MSCRSCRVSRVGVHRHDADAGQLVVNGERREFDGNLWDRRRLRPEAQTKRGRIGQPSGVEIGSDGIGQLGLAGSLEGQSKQFDRHLAGPAIVAAFP